MKVLPFIFGFLLAISYLPAKTFSLPLTSRDEAATFQLYFIGSADGKSFFAENSTLLTWFEARKFCANSGMNLASITSLAQQNVLKNIPLPGVFWTGGRDAQTHAQFVWDVEKSPLNETSTGPIHNFNSIQTCLYYAALPDYMLLEAYDCTYKCGVLCEVKT